MREKKAMMRVLKCEEGIILDTTGKKNGRGAYLCKSAECLKLAAKNRGLERSLKVQIPKEVYEALEKEFGEINGQNFINDRNGDKSWKNCQW